MGKRGWILTALGVFTAVVIGGLAAMMVFPSDQPKPAAGVTAATVRIDPVPAATPAIDITVPPPPLRIPARAPSVARKSRLAPSTHAEPDADPATTTTINSW